MSAIGSPELGSRSERKDKKTKSEKKSSKKRHREEDSAVDGTRKHKKSKSTSDNVNGQVATNGDHEDTEPKSSSTKKSKHKKTETEHDVGSGDEKVEKKKHKKKKHPLGGVEDDANDAAESEKKSKKKKSRKDRENGVSEDHTGPEIAQSQDVEAATSPRLDLMDVDEPSQPTSKAIYQPPDIPQNPQFPFFSQTVSLYEPIYPVSWAQPVTNCDYQYLRHLQNRYVPSLRGVLINYKNVALGAQPGRDGGATDDESPTELMSKNETAVGFGWITADVELFMPSRGAWMEGSVNLQTEGHIGVVCFGKFNASIEARRLPAAWKWISNEDPEAQGMEETASIIAPDEHGVVRQIHSTGFWADADGDKIKGRIRFRIRNFDVGVTGDTTYLSLEGTMLDKAAEKALVKEEAETVRLRKGNRGGRGHERRRAPEFSMTHFMTEEEQKALEEQEGAVAVSATATEQGTKTVFDE